MRVVAVSGAVALVMLTFLSALLGVFGAFLVPWDPAPGVSVGVVLAVVGNYLVSRRARGLTRTAVPAAAPAVAWLAVVMTLASGRSEGDLVLTGSAPSLAFIVLGALAAAVALGRTPGSRAVDPEPPAAAGPVPLDD